MRRENFIEKLSAALGFLSGVIVFLSGPIMTMTWLHFLVPLGLNVDVSSFLWYDAHACSVISESLIKLLGANQTRDSSNTWVTHFIREIIQDSSTTW
jgi:hypothetical protein